MAFRPDAPDVPIPIESNKPSSGRKVLGGKTPLKPKFVPPTVDFKSAGRDAEVSYFMTGMDSLMKNLEMLPPYFKDIAGYEMEKIAAEIIEDSRENYCPYLFGNLKDSARSDSYVPGRGIEVTEIGMWYAGPPDLGLGAQEQTVGKSTLKATAIQGGLHEIDVTKYALEQHENTGFKHPQGGQAKYLEVPFLQAVPTILPRIAKAIEAEGETL